MLYSVQRRTHHPIQFLEATVHPNTPNCKPPFPMYTDTPLNKNSKSKFNPKTRTPAIIQSPKSHTLLFAQAPKKRAIPIPILPGIALIEGSIVPLQRRQAGKAPPACTFIIIIRIIIIIIIVIIMEIRLLMIIIEIKIEERRRWDPGRFGSSSCQGH